MIKKIWIDDKELTKFSDIEIITLLRPFYNFLEEADEEIGKSEPSQRVVGYKVIIDEMVYYTRDMKNYNNKILVIKTSKRLAYYD